jgi:hypothetical protein
MPARALISRGTLVPDLFAWLISALACMPAGLASSGGVLQSAEGPSPVQTLCALTSLAGVFQPAFDAWRAAADGWVKNQ